MMALTIGGSLTLRFLLALVGAPPESHAPSEIEVEGVAAVINNDLGMARDRALDDAKRKSVEQVAGAHVSSETLTQNFQLVEDRVLARASGFVKTYTIASEWKDADQTYHVKIRAVVDVGAVAENLDQLFKEKPRVIVLIAEQNVGSPGFSFWWGGGGNSASEMDILQTSLISAWQPKGYKFVDPGLLEGRLKAEKALQNPMLSNEGAVSIGKDADADIAIVGKVLVSDAGPVIEGTRMRSFHAVGNLRVLSVDTAEIIVVRDETGVAQHIDSQVGSRAAIKALAQKLGETLDRAILAKWTSEAASALELDVVATGVKRSAMLEELKRVMRSQVRGVESVNVRRRKGNVGFLTVSVRGDAASFSRDVEAQTFTDFGVETVGVTRSKVTFRLKGR